MYMIIKFFSIDDILDWMQLSHTDYLHLTIIFLLPLPYTDIYTVDIDY